MNSLAIALHLLVSFFSLTVDFLGSERNTVSPMTAPSCSAVNDSVGPRMAVGGLKQRGTEDGGDERCIRNTQTLDSIRRAHCDLHVADEPGFCSNICPTDEHYTYKSSVRAQFSKRVENQKQTRLLHIQHRQSRKLTGGVPPAQP